MEMLIREGHLQRYVQEEDRNGKEPQRREERLERQERHDQREQERIRDYRQNPPLNNEPIHQAIHVISYIKTLTSDTFSSQKAYAHLAYLMFYILVISFDDEK